MNTISPEQFQSLLPLACEWVAEQEQFILRKGTSLTASQIKDAQLVGVTRPELVRLLKVEKIPLPAHSVLRAAANSTQLLSPDTSGITFRYGIFIQAPFWGDRPLVVHELVHTRQYEQLGGIQPFLQQYLMECLTIGYPESPMEQEAINVARVILSRERRL